jgi:hypothetical protein
MTQLTKDEFSVRELQHLAEERELWVKEAIARDLHGSAKEWALTAAIARELAALKMKHGRHDGQ